MIERLAHFVVRRRRLVLVVFVVGVLVAAAVGSSVFARLGSQGYDNPKSESTRVANSLANEFRVSDPFVVLVVDTSAGVDAPSSVAAATAYVARVSAISGVKSAVSYWTSGRPASLRSTDGRAGEVLVYAPPGGKPFDLARTISASYSGAQPGGLRVAASGFGVLNNAINDQVKKDIAKAEAIAVPLTIVLLILVFGSLVSAGLPFIVAMGAILTSFLVLFLISLATDVSVFALNLITGLGLGLGIDYALLIVNRYREELRVDGDVESAVVRTLTTAGRTVLVSGVTVAVTMAALLVFPQYFLRSFAYAGVAVTLLAVLSALIALPAVLGMLGKNVDRFKVRKGDLAPRDTGAWSRLAAGVMHRPWPVLLAVIAVLLVFASPVLNVKFSQTDERVLPKGNPALVATQMSQLRFPGQEAAPIDIVVPGGAHANLADYAKTLSKVSDVVRVVTPTSVFVHGIVVGLNPQPATWTAGNDARLQAISDTSPRTQAGIDLVSNVRAIPAPAPGTGVGGGAAAYADAQQAIASRLPWALGWIALATMIVLFLYTGSVLLPIKAVALNVLSLGAMMGVVVWIFQDGHLRWLVGDFNVTGTVDTAIMVLTAVVAFALSMDYEVFLLSRIKEEHNSGRDTASAVSVGLQRSGRIITAAAMLIAVSFAAFVTAGVSNIKQLGVGVAFAVLVDATIVRALLVPAFMRIAGKWNWWAPAPLRAVHARFGLSD
jgi:RND superfamily putative drug exporter